MKTEYLLMTGNKTIKNILITGANGFLGSHLVNFLSKSYKLFGLEHNTNNLFRLKSANIRVFEYQKSNLEQIIIDNNIDAIIHTATVYRTKEQSIDKLINTNIELPVHLYEIANKLEVKVFLNTDSFFNNPEYHYSYLNEYTLSKRHSLEWLRAIGGACKMVNMKIFHMYGPNDSPNKFIPFIINELKTKPSIALTPGEQKRDFIYIDDVVYAYEKVLESFNLFKPLEEFQIGTGTTTSIKELVILLKQILKSKTELHFGSLNYRSGEIMESNANNTGLKQLDWKPLFDLETGLKMTI